MHVSSTQVLTCCPVCNNTAHRVHSRYERTLRDLPCVDFCLTILLQVCKFFCPNENCQRRIFTERIPQVALPWARRTVRCSQQLSALGLALGGAAASRLSYQLHYGNSRNTLLRAIRQLSLPSVKTPKYLGVDDFALRRGHHYGTILVNLETHQPIGLLPDRESGTLANWLKEHPGVEIISRDRSKAYRAGASAGAPEAIQVADRFHILRNLEEALEAVFNTQSQALQLVEQALLPAKTIEPSPTQIIDLPQESPEDVRVPKHTPSRARRLAQYDQAHALRQQGHKIKDIAHHLGIDKKTVIRFLSFATFPEYKTSKRRSYSALNPYKAYLKEQWQAGHHNTKKLFQEIQQQGYPGSYSRVARYTHKLREQFPSRPQPDSLKELPGRGPAPDKGLKQSHKPLTARRSAWLVMRKSEHLTPEEEQKLEQLEQQPELSVAIALTQSFLLLVRKRLPQHLDDWLQRAKESSLKPLQSFARGVVDDYEAVKAALTLEISNGPVEGQNNRLKMLKRQMYGRAGLDLLNIRLVLGN